MKISERSKRLAGTMETIVPQIINQLFSPEEVGFVTVTAIEVSGDLGIADIFVASMGTDVDFVKVINKAQKKISHLVNQKLALRRTVRLKFKLDKSTKHVEKMQKLGIQ